MVGPRGQRWQGQPNHSLFVQPADSEDVLALAESDRSAGRVGPLLPGGDRGGPRQGTAPAVEGAAKPAEAGGDAAKTPAVKRVRKAVAPAGTPPKGDGKGE